MSEVPDHARTGAINADEKVRDGAWVYRRLHTIESVPKQLMDAVPRLRASAIMQRLREW